MKQIVKEGPQLTGAQALDVILARLDSDIKSADACTDEGWRDGKKYAYEMIREFVCIIRAEKFNDTPTEEPWKNLAGSRSYAL